MSMSEAFSYEAPAMVETPQAASTAHQPAAGGFEYGAGATVSTMNFMMLSVGAVYVLLFAALLASCMCGKKRAGYAQFDPEAGPSVGLGKTPVSELDQVWRKAFIMKVYSILGAQLLVTVFTSFAMMTFGGRDLYAWLIFEGSWLPPLSVVGLLVTLCALLCFRQKYPHNFIILVLFTLCSAAWVGIITTSYAARGLSSLVVEAFAITSIIFVGLTLFTIQSKIDFSFLGAGLFVALFGLMVWSFFAMYIFPSFVFRQVYALAGSVIFSLYIVYDTWMITKALSYDEYILGAINLYLDFVNLFLMILRLLAGSRE